MRLFLYNTLTRQKEEFIPLHPGKVGMYSCGPTVYSMPHFGNMRSIFTAGLLRDVLKYVMMYDTTVVSNFTDVWHIVGDVDSGEDKLEKGSRIEWLSAWDVAKKYENIFREYFGKLRIPLFDVMPRATEHITEQIAMIKTLKEKGYTYTVPSDGIYMDTSMIADYGKLLGANYKKHLEGLQAGERIDMWGKRHPTDFALWKFSPTDEKRQMERESPWWIGFPGWHIECSAMSKKYLGEQFDIHHGGVDLIPVHHSNEIAQSECCDNVHPWVKYWVHHQFVNMYGKKMSKSDGNYVAPSELLEKGYDFLDIKYWFFSAHYRSFLDFTWKNIETAKNARAGLIKKLSGKRQDFALSVLQEQKLFQDLSDALCDDLNTSKFLGLMYEALGRTMNDVEYGVLTYFEDYVMRLWLFDEQVVLDIPVEITALADQRVQAKNDKNYVLADELRRKIIEFGYSIKDIKNGKWYEIDKI